ncbi:MAG TPA: site-2 protease family protein [Clostridiales bacterium]|nr:site-2 protease family protein [Clostridiales bacterium]
MAEIWSKIWQILLAIVFFGIIIFVHELGHFVFAKLFKVKVNEFALGMGPRLFGFTKGDTKYSLRLFPIGGYCAMEGENEDSEDSGAFCNKKVWQRIIIVAAGATMNILLGFIIFGILNSSADLVGTTKIARFDDNAVSATCDLKEGDRIIKIDGTRIFTATDMAYCLTRGDDQYVDMTIERDGKKIELVEVEFPQEEYEGRTILIRDFWLLGEEPNFFNRLSYTLKETIATENMVRLSLLDMITGKYGLKDLSGPIGTMEIISDAAGDISSDDKEERKAAIEYLLFLMAFISINIGMVNVLPIPALDGGRLFFLVIEAIRRKPIPQKYEAYVHAAGMILLLALIAVISLKDIIYLFK